MLSKVLDLKMLGTVVWPCAGVASKAVARRAAAAAGGMTAWKPLVASFSGCRRSAGAAAPTGSRSKYTYPTVSPEEEKFIVKSPYPEVEIPMMNLADYVWQDVDKRGDDVALVSRPRPTRTTSKFVEKVPRRSDGDVFPVPNRSAR